MRGGVWWEARVEGAELMLLLPRVAGREAMTGVPVEETHAEATSRGVMQARGSTTLASSQHTSSKLSPAFRPWPYKSFCPRNRDHYWVILTVTTPRAMPHATLPPPGFQALILCGPGASLGTFTSSPKDIPKALLPIANRPMVWYPLEWCYRMGVTGKSISSTNAR